MNGNIIRAGVYIILSQLYRYGDFRYSLCGSNYISNNLNLLFCHIILSRPTFMVILFQKHIQAYIYTCVWYW